MDRPTAIPLPRGASEACVAPSPIPCAWCHGDGIEPDEENGLIPCLACGGGGVEPVAFDLPRTRALEVRKVEYEPACGGIGALRLTTAAKPTHRPLCELYQLVECRHDDGGQRGFLLAKVSRPDRRHEIEVGPLGVRCSCEGETYMTSAKANQRAHESGEEVYPTYGCKHCDSVVALLLGGWFDL